MDKRELQKLLNQPYKQENWKSIVQFVFPNVTILSTPKEFPIGNDKIKGFSQIGSVRLHDGKSLALFELILKDNVNIQRNRVELNNEISKFIDQEQIHGVLSVFEQGTEDYRFTFSAKTTEFDYEESDFISTRTDTKRYTYVLGQNESCRTAADRFYNLHRKKERAEISDVTTAFSVEQVSKEFFDKYEQQFEKFWTYLANEEKFNSLFRNPSEEKRKRDIRDFTKKLLGRIVFLHFLQKKGWMGCPSGSAEWLNGNKQFMRELFDEYEDKEHFHSECLHQLFYQTLNVPREDDLFSIEKLGGEINNTKIPYLNGGLFDSDETVSKQIDFPSEYFENLLDFFSQYNFTIDENDPNDHEVGIDPEMLGHIFENLLEDNNDKGTFYTPKAIVQYMCQESLLEYLKTAVCSNEVGSCQEALEQLVREKLAEKVSDLDLVAPISKALYNIKICDPAIGSGAFPMGMLNEIFQVTEALYWLQHDTVAPIWNISSETWEPHVVKQNIIQHSIYGVDIESGAVDIARLRFWLALVVDETEPVPLPNLDYKIMQGNSLFESFEGIDLSQISSAEAYEAVYEDSQVDLFTGEAKKSVKISLNFEDINQMMEDYFSSSNGEEKRELHRRIDEQVLNHIKFTLLNHKNELEAKVQPIKRKLKSLEESASNWEQKEHIRNNSKEAKKLKIFQDKLGALNEQEMKLGILSNSNERPFFLWHLFFREVFDDGGFDIIIGNPPYGASLSDYEKNVLKVEYADIVDRIRNSFLYFIGLGERLCKDKGNLFYIVPNEFLFQIYMGKARDYYLNNATFLTAIDMGLNVFDAVVPSCIVGIKKSKREGNYSINVANLREKKSLSNIGEALIPIDKELVEIYPNSTFAFEERNIKLVEKLAKQGQPLGDMAEMLSNGISTSCDEVYIVQKDDIDSYQIENSVCFPCLRGNQINKFKIPESSEDSILYVTKDTELESVPNAVNYLTDNKEYLISKSVEKRTGKRKWQILFRARNPELFSSPKIIFRQTGDRPICAVDKTYNYYCIDSLNVLRLKDEYNDIIDYIAGVCNSSLMTFFYQEISQEKGRALAQVKPQRLKAIPILYDKQYQKELIQIVESIRKSKVEEDQKTNQKKLNILTCKIYGISYSELEIVDTELFHTLSEEEYNAMEL